jgi:hypothetical protein
MTHMSKIDTKGITTSSLIVSEPVQRMINFMASNV